MLDGQAAHDILTPYAFKVARNKATQLEKRPEFSDCDCEDIEQELLIYLAGKADGYNPERSSPKTFITRIITSGVRELVRSRTCQKRHPFGDDVFIQSLEMPIDTVDGQPANLAAELSLDDLERRTGSSSQSDVVDFDRKEAIEKAMETLPEDYRKICRLLMTKSQAETMAEMGLSRRQFATARAFIAEHFERVGATKD